MVQNRSTNEDPKYDVFRATLIPGLLIDPDTRPSGLIIGDRLLKHEKLTS